MIFIKDGKIAEQGTHEELINKKVRMTSAHTKRTLTVTPTKLRVVFLQAWPRLTPREMPKKGTTREAGLVGIVSSFFAFISLFDQNQQV